MSNKSLLDGFSKLGMTSREISEAMTPLGERFDKNGIDNGIGDNAYLSEEGSVEEGFVKLRPLAVRRKAAKAAKIRRRSGSGKQAYLHQLKMAKTGVAKQKRKKHYKLLKARGGPKKGSRMMTASFDNPGKGLKIMSEKLMQNIMQLAEAIDRDPEDRFDEYAEAFNHIADIGELAAIQLMDVDEEAAKDVLNLSLAAESVLKHMESLDGALTEEEDADLEETLQDAMESVGEYMTEYGLITEEDEEDDDEDEDEDDDDLEEDYLNGDEDDDLLSAFRTLKEARAAVKAKGKKGRGKKEIKRMAPPKSRKIMTAKGIKRKKGASNWSKKNPAGNASSKQIANRGDVRDKEALLGYLRQVKMGKVAPGQSLR